MSHETALRGRTLEKSRRTPPCVVKHKLPNQATSGLAGTTLVSVSVADQDWLTQKCARGATCANSTLLALRRSADGHGNRRTADEWARKSLPSNSSELASLGARATRQCWKAKPTKLSD